MACCGNTEPLTPQQKYGVRPGTPCEAITVDLLTLYKNKIDCYLTYKLWNNIQSTQAELENASMYLQAFISQKMADPTNCAGIDDLWIVRQIVDKIVILGACL